MFIGMLTADELVVSSYRVATTIPFALLFFPGAIATYIYPHFVRHKYEREWTLKSYVLVTLGGGLLMACITLFFILFARPIVVLIFGGQDLDAVPVMQIVMIGFFVTATFRTPAGNLLITQRKLVTNSVIGIVLIALCTVSSFALIPSYGMMGAAVSYDICMIIGSVLSCGAYLVSIYHLKA